MLVPNPRALVPPQAVILSKLLLAEGNTPAHFFDALLKSMGLDSHIEIRNYGGVKELGPFVRALASTTEFQEKVVSLGITRDAEDDPKAAMQSVEAAVKSATIASRVAVKIAILPDGTNAGMIETLCMRSVSSSPVLECIDQFMACVERKGIVLPVGHSRAKHAVQLYLAAQSEPQMMPGIAAHRGAWPFSDPAFDAIKSFLQGL